MGTDWGNGDFMAPNKEARIAAHRAPRFRDKLRAFVFATRLGAWTCWKYNRYLFWQLTLGLFGFAFGFAFVVVGIVVLLIRSVF